MKWSEYKPTGLTKGTAVIIDHDDEWSHVNNAVSDQLQLYEQEPYPVMLQKDSPIPYWISKRKIWLELA
jgi:hypothetical protein